VSDRPPLHPGQILLTDKLVLVTGAARGIGAACAVAMARFGADVMMCDRDADGLHQVAMQVSDLGRSATTAVLDVRDRTAVDAWVSGLVQDLPAIDVVLNNAGGGFPAPFTELSDRAQDALVAENFTSAANVIRAAVPHVPDGGSVITITSVEAHRAAPGFAVYAAMKAGLANLTRSLALELAPRGIRVNAVAPDVIPTPGLDMLEAASAAKAARDEAMQPWPNPGHADDVAAAVIWLASPMSAFVTGTTVHVDGGTWASGGWRRRLSDDGYLL
jgi:NAD(P)-dependent dehydrogenase (short-subunit alcohol dehydrogenase family)